jgi:hypothetical protein
MRRRPAGELPGRSGRPAHDAADLLKVEIEHVVKNKGKPLGGREFVKHDKERETHGVSEQRLLLRVSAMLWARCRRGLGYFQ